MAGAAAFLLPLRSDGQARAAVIEFRGFLGIGSNEVAVGGSKLQVAEAQP
jgi:hypothetical protein